MEVKIGIQQAPRELVFESDDDAAALTKKITAAWKAGGLVTLEDTKGRNILIPAEKITYVELGEPKVGRVGFGG